MKLVEILAKELVEWPERAEYAVQDGDSRKTIKFGKTKGNLGIKAEGHSLDVWQNKSWGFTSQHDFDHDEQASDFLSSIVTRAQWQAERDRQKGGEWKRHRGGKQPVADDVRVEVKLRDGDTQEAKACAFLWNHSDCDTYANIMQYRVISQPQAEVGVMKGPFVANAANQETTEVELEDFISSGTWHEDQVESPFKWRDTVNELDAYIEEFTREREALINRLALEGFALLPAMAPVVGVGAAPISLPFSQWMAGDIVIGKVDYNRQFTKGKKYTVTQTSVSLGDNRVSVEEDDKGEANGWNAKHFEFHSRP